MDTSDSSMKRPSNAWFGTTHWSVVLAAGRQDTPRAQAALETLCRIYWPPLYGYVRRQGHSPEDAADVTQEFFRRLLERESLAEVHPAKGRFRTFLLAAMNHLLADEWDKARAKKRGAHQIIAMDFRDVETRLVSSVPEVRTPEEAYERQWALALLDEVHRRLEREQCEQGQAALFAALRPTLAGRSESQPYAELARELGMSEGAVRTAVHRLRQRYREILRATIAETVCDPGEVEEELHHLMQVLRRN